MERNQEYCPQCPNHCHKSQLRCGRGRSYFGLEGDGQHERKTLTGVAGLLRQCGHLLHHNEELTNEVLCEGLTQEEQKTLEGLLNKILSNADAKK